VKRLILALVLAALAQPAFAAAYTYRSTGTVATNTTGAALNPGAPAGLTTGDLMILTSCSALDGTAAEDTGWTNIYEDTDGTTPDIEVWARVADGGANDAATIDWSGVDDATAWISAYSGDVYTDVATIVSASNPATGGGQVSDISLGTLDVTVDDTLVFHFGCKKKTATSNDATTLTAPSGGGTTKRAQVLVAGNGFFVISSDVAQTTATDHDGSNFTRNGTNEAANVSSISLSLLSETAAAPTFLAGPTPGTKTQIAVPFTFTSDTTATVKGVACPNGQAAPSVAQVIAGDCTGDVGAVATISEAVVATVSDAGTFTGLTAATTYDTHFAIDAATDSAAISSVADQTTVAAPTITAGPAPGTHTSTALVITFTSDQNGDVLGVACPDGQAAPSVAQVLAGNCTGGIAAESAFTQAVFATVADGDTFTGLDPSTTYDTHYAQTNAAGNSAAISTLANQTTAAPAAGVFTVNPTVTAQDTNDYTLSGTTSAAVTVSAVACIKDSTAPTMAQVIAGDCTGDVNAIAAVSESWNGADSFILGGALTLKIHDLYATDGTSLVTRADESLDPAAGKQRFTLSSLHSTSPYFGQGVAAGDICDVDTVTDPGAFVINDAAHTHDHLDGTVDYNGGGSTSRQLIDADCHDVSASIILAFLLVYNNSSPQATDGFYFDQDVFLINTDPAFDLAARSTDPDGDDIDFSVVSGMPTDFVLDGETGVLSDGTPGACRDPSDLTIRLTDIYGATTDVANTVGVGEPVPDLVGLTEAEAEAIIAGLCNP